MSRRYYADDYMVVGATAALTIGTVLGLAGVAADAPATAISGGAVAALALGMLVTANLVSGAMVVVLSVALPAVYSSADLRIAFAAPVAALASFAWLLRVCFERRDIAVGRMPVRALSFMLVAMIISSLFSDSIGSSLRETANFVVL